MAILKRPIIILLLFVIIAAVGVFTLWRLLAKRAPEGRLILYGNVDIRQVNLAFEVTERIDGMLVEEGSPVKKGDLLAALQKERLRAAVLSKAGQAEAQAQVVARLEAGSRPEEIERAAAEYEAAKVRAANAAVTNKRFQALRLLDAQSAQKADDANAAALSAAADANASAQNLELAVLGPRQEDIAEARQTLNRYTADLEIAKRDLADANLFAPSDGVIQTRVLEPGDIASPQVPAYIVALTDPVWVRAYVSETDLGKIYEGMPAKVTTDSFPGKTYDAWIGFISPTAEFTPKSVETTDIRTHLVYQVRVYVKNPENQLRLGMPATVIIDLPD